MGSSARWPTAVRVVAYTLVLYASWNHNVFGLPGGIHGWGYRVDPRAGHVGADSAVILHRLRAAADGAVPPLYPLLSSYDDGRPVGYGSQFGGHGVAWAAVQQAVGADPAAFAAVAAGGSCLLTAVVYALVFAAAGRRFRPAAGDVAAALFSFAPPLVYDAPSPYWAVFLLAGPFAVVWVFGAGRTPSASEGVALPPRSRSGFARTGLLAGVAALTCAKCLCGYEYVSTVILAAVAALWYRQAVAGVPVLRRWRGIALVCAAGTAGFAVAVGLHMAQLRLVLDTDPIAAIGERAAARTVAAAGPDPAAAFRGYFDQPALAAPSSWSRRHHQLPLKWLVVLTAAAVGVGVVRPRTFPPGLVGAAVLGLVAGVGWQAVAVNHMATHPHQNGIVYHVAFVPLVLVLIGTVVAAVADRLRAGRLLPVALLIGLTVTVAFSLTAARRQWRADARAEAAAAEAVRRLAGRPPTPAPGIACHVERFGPEDGLESLIRVELGRTPMTEPVADREPMIVLVGWAVDWTTADPYRAPPVVLTVDGEVVPAWVARYGRADQDGRVGRRAAGAGFVLVAPQRLVPAGAAVRVVAVGAADPNRMAAADAP